MNWVLVALLTTAVLTQNVIADECSGVGRYVVFQGKYKSYTKGEGKFTEQDTEHLMLLDTCTGKLFICRSYTDLDKGVSLRGCIPFHYEAKEK